MPLDGCVCWDGRQVHTPLPQESELIQPGAISSAFLVASEIEGLIILNHPGYTYHPWHLTLITIAVGVVVFIFNTVLAHKLPAIEGAALVLHLLGFLAILIPLWVLAPRASSTEVWTTFANPGWSSTGLSVLIGIISPSVSLIGSDAATHMSEEVKDASRVLPLAMFTAITFNGILGFIMLITMCYCLGDLNAVFESPVTAIGVPFIQVFANGVKSNAGASVMTAILIVLGTFGAITNGASASRQLFAFARDHGVPFSGFFSYVSQSLSKPTITHQVRLNQAGIFPFLLW
jgi:choline transport protein